ncbi:MAG: ADP-ribosylglycohydrolase family protein [Armatimonadota bacterium]
MIEIDYATYYNKVLGCWQGKCIGGSFGAPIEGVKSANDLHYYVNQNDAQIANDDLDIQLVWVHALKEYGLDLTSYELLHEWMDHVLFPWNEYGYAMKNFRTGIRPPWSGSFNNSFFGESMGCPIRSEIWGLIAPGNPELAARYAEEDAVLDHYGNSVHAEKFLSAIEAAAFVESDPRRLVEIGMSVVPDDSRLARCIRFVTDCHLASVPMMEARSRMLNRFGQPDMTSSVQNLGIMAMALLYGDGDFERTLVGAVNCGYDSDCTGATVGAIMGIVLGSDKLPGKWVDPIGDDIISLLRIEELLEKSSIRSLSTETCRFGAAVSQRPGSMCVICDVPAEEMEKVAAIAGRCGHDVSLRVEYPGNPSISFSSGAEALISVTNNTGRTVDARIEFDAPHHLMVSFTEASLVLPPLGTATIDVLVSVKDGVTKLPAANKIGLVCSWDGKSRREEFGFAGASEWMVIGPYRETFPKSMIKPCNFQQHGNPDLPPIELMVMNYVDFDKEYLPEPGFSEEGCTSGVGEVERIRVHAHEDKVPLDDVFTMSGPQVVYLVRKIHLDEPRKVWTLTNGRDGVKLWINGKQLINSHEHGFENPAYHFAEVDLPSGISTIAAKVIRCGSNFGFSFLMREHNGKHWHQEQHFLGFSNVKTYL